MVRLAILSTFIFLLSACSNMRSIESGRNSGDAQQPTEAHDILEQSVLNQGSHHPAVQALLNKAEQAHLNNDFTRAFKYLDQARQIEPRNAEIFYRQGLLKLKQGQPQKARQLLLRAKTLTQDAQLIERINRLLSFN